MLVPSLDTASATVVPSGGTCARVVSSVAWGMAMTVGEPVGTVDSEELALWTAVLRAARGSAFAS
jgi:hypothetical protein